MNNATQPYPVPRGTLAQEALKELARRELARRHMAAFVLYTMPNYQMGWWHEEICQALDVFLDDVVCGKSPRLMIKTAPRHGKQIADSVPVLTPNGWRNHGDLCVGDYVFGIHGKMVKVVAISSKSPEKVEVVFTNGDTIKCHPAHEWVVYKGRGKRLIRVETQEMAKYNLWTGEKGKRGSRALFHLPDTSGLEFPTKSLLLCPYALGVWLGDGTTGKGCISMSVNDSAVWERMAESGLPISTSWVHKDTGVVTVSFASGIPGVLGVLPSKLSQIGVLNYKHIPEEYLRADRQQRLELLAGLMDTDGHVEAHTGRCRIVTTSPEIRDGVYDLCSTLGFRPYITHQLPALSSSGIQGNLTVFTVGFQPTEAIPVSLERKRVKNFAKRRMIGIAEIRNCGQECGKCIQVDSPDGIYLVGKTLLPTHNSELASRRFPAYAFGRYPDIGIISTSYSADLSSRMNRDVQRILESETYPKLFPKTTLWGKNIRTVSGAYQRNSDLFEIVGYQGSYRSAGVGGGITGMGMHIGIIDDFCRNRADADSPTLREKTWDWYTSSFYTRLAPGGGILVIATSWHQDDLMGRLLEAERTGEGDKWKVISYPAIATNDEPKRKAGEALHAERYPLEQLEKIKAALGSRDWEALYQQRPTPDGGAVFRKEWLNYYLPKDLPDRFDKTIISWDMAFKDGDDNDYVVGQVWGRHGGRFFLLDQVRGRMDFVATLAAFDALAVKWPHAMEKLVEDKANGPAVISSLKHKVMGIIPINPDGSKTARAHAVTPLFEAGNVFIPHPHTCSWAGDYISELLQFPASAHDDQVDATTQALRRLTAVPALQIHPSNLPRTFRRRRAA